LLFITIIVSLTLSLFFLSGVMKPFFFLVFAEAASSLARTSAFFFSRSSCFLRSSCCVERSNQLLESIAKFSLRTRLVVRNSNSSTNECHLPRSFLRFDLLLGTQRAHSKNSSCFQNYYYLVAADSSLMMIFSRPRGQIMNAEIRNNFKWE
jgi:hypothetical protein